MKISQNSSSSQSVEITLTDLLNLHLLLKHLKLIFHPGIWRSSETQSISISTIPSIWTSSLPSPSSIVLMPTAQSEIWTSKKPVKLTRPKHSQCFRPTWTTCGHWHDLQTLIRQDWNQAIHWSSYQARPNAELDWFLCPGECSGYLQTILRWNNFH